MRKAQCSVYSGGETSGRLAGEEYHSGLVGIGGRMAEGRKVKVGKNKTLADAEAGIDCTGLT